VSSAYLLNRDEGALLCNLLFISVRRTKGRGCAWARGAYCVLPTLIISERICVYIYCICHSYIFVFGDRISKKRRGLLRVSVDYDYDYDHCGEGERAVSAQRARTTQSINQSTVLTNKARRGQGRSHIPAPTQGAANPLSRSGAGLGGCYTSRNSKSSQPLQLVRLARLVQWCAINLLKHTLPPPPLWSATQTRVTYNGLCGMPACGHAVECGVCDTPEFWRGATGLCARVRAWAGAAESLHTYIHTSSGISSHGQTRYSGTCSRVMLTTIQ